MQNTLPEIKQAFRQCCSHLTYFVIGTENILGLFFNSIKKNNIKSAKEITGSGYLLVVRVCMPVNVSVFPLYIHNFYVIVLVTNKNTCLSL